MLTLKSSRAKTQTVRNTSRQQTSTPIPPKLFTEMTERADFTNRKQQ